MSSVGTAEQALTIGVPHKVIHPAWVRVTHWINALAMLLMIGSGWQIYDASPLFGFEFPKQIALGNWLGGALLWHFAAMWLLVINGLVYVSLGLLTGRFRRKLFRFAHPRSCAISWPHCAANSRTTICPSTTPCRNCFISAFCSPAS